MLYRALVSFSGVVSMTMGEIGEISDPSIVKDLLKAGYIVEVPQEDQKVVKKKAAKKM